jgi:hypothetical protein
MQESDLGDKKMKLRFSALWALALLALLSLAVPVHAQTPAAKTRPTAPAGPFNYDASKETTLTGTVSSVLKKSNPGMIMGSHLMLQTPSGTVDASLGRFGLIGKTPLSVQPGQQVSVTGVMKTIKDKPVFLVRTVTVGSEVHMIRNERGVLLSPQSRERLSQQSGTKGEQL